MLRRIYYVHLRVRSSHFKHGNELKSLSTAFFSSHSTTRFTIKQNDALPKRLYIHTYGAYTTVPEFSRFEKDDVHSTDQYRWHFKYSQTNVTYSLHAFSRRQYSCFTHHTILNPLIARQHETCTITSAMASGICIPDHGLHVTNQIALLFSSVAKIIVLPPTHTRSTVQKH
jgi:hypothetical protein